MVEITITLLQTFQVVYNIPYFSYINVLLSHMANMHPIVEGRDESFVFQFEFFMKSLCFTLTLHEKIKGVQV